MRTFAAFKKFAIAAIFAITALGAFNQKINEVFECDRQSGECEYKYNTFISREYRVFHVCSLNDVKKVNYKFYQTESKNRRGETKVSDHYTIVFGNADKVYEFPIEIQNAETAQAEAEKFGGFLKSSEPKYTYHKGMNQIILSVIFILAVLGAYYFAKRGIVIVKEGNSVKNKEAK